MRYLLTTTNKGKIRHYGTKLKEQGIDIVTLNDLNINVDVDETGKNPTENAIIKANEYNNLSNVPTIALDEGLFLEGAPDEIQPGTHVRRVNGKLPCYFLKCVAFDNGDKTYTFKHKVNREFTNQQSSVIDEGYPLASSQIIQTSGKFKSKLTDEEEKITMDVEQKDIFDFILNTINMIEQINKIVW